MEQRTFAARRRSGVDAIQTRVAFVPQLKSVIASVAVAPRCSATELRPHFVIVTLAAAAQW